MLGPDGPVWGHPQPRSGEGASRTIGPSGDDAGRDGPVWGHPQPRSGEGAIRTIGPSPAARPPT
jgi:hypothetical protein